MPEDTPLAVKMVLFLNIAVLVVFWFMLREMDRHLQAMETAQATQVRIQREFTEEMKRTHPEMHSKLNKILGTETNE